MDVVGREGAGSSGLIQGFAVPVEADARPALAEPVAEGGLPLAESDTSLVAGAAELSERPFDAAAAEEAEEDDALRLASRGGSTHASASSFGSG